MCLFDNHFKAFKINNYFTKLEAALASWVCGLYRHTDNSHGMGGDGGQGDLVWSYRVINPGFLTDLILELVCQWEVWYGREVYCYFLQSQCVLCPTNTKISVDFQCTRTQKDSKKGLSKYPKSFTMLTILSEHHTLVFVWTRTCLPCRK